MLGNQLDPGSEGASLSVSHLFLLFNIPMFIFAYSAGFCSTGALRCMSALVVFVGLQRMT
jgi:hypothetical protein